MASNRVGTPTHAPTVSGLAFGRREADIAAVVGAGTQGADGRRQIGVGGDEDDIGVIALLAQFLDPLQSRSPREPDVQMDRKP